MIPNEKIKLHNHVDEPKHLFQLFKVYIDDFITVVQATSNNDLCYTSRALLHSIESICPNRISISKLRKEEK